jgi:signal transduction histidine kinase
MGSMCKVVKQLDKERARVANELHKVTAALTAFGKVYLDAAKPTRKRGKEDVSGGAEENRSLSAREVGKD